VPEGDTIKRSARALEKALVGKKVRAAVSHVEHLDARSLEGRVVVSVEARGKHLLVRFDDGRALHSHMRMDGTWRLVPPGELKRRANSPRLRVALDVGDVTAICFDAPTVRLLRKGEEARDARLVALGPDLLADTFDAEEARNRLRRDPNRAIGDAILDQNLLAGVGNIYKSETLFECRVNPFALVSALDDRTLDKIIARARALLSANDGRKRRPTVGASARIWVYQRAGRPCRRCGTTIEMKRQGELARSTYWCPKCQVGSTSSSFGNKSPLLPSSTRSN